MPFISSAIPVSTTLPAPSAMPVGREPDPSSSSTIITSNSSPIMRKASPLPLPARPVPGAPWQHFNGSNGSSPTSTSESNKSPAGKTSQVLARLTSENDKLRRELKAERAAREEITQQFQVLKGQVNRLEEKNDTISHQNNTIEGALARKERRIDDLRVSLDEESARRKRAEEREAEMGRKLGETVSQAAKEVAGAHTIQKASESAYFTIAKEYAGLQRQIDLLRQELQRTVTQIDAEKAIHRKQLMQLEVLLDQQRHQFEKTTKQVEDMSLLIQSYRKTEENVQHLEKQMKETVDEMRWVMRLHQSRQDKASHLERSL